VVSFQTDRTTIQSGKVTSVSFCRRKVHVALSIEEIQRQLQQRINTRRQTGDYPPGLEEQLEAEFRDILETTYRGTRGLDHLEARMNMLREAMAQIRGLGGPATSRVPLGGLFHRFTRRIIRRHTTALAAETRASFDRVEFVLHEIEFLLKAQRSHDERLLNEVLSSMLDRLATIDALVEAVIRIESNIATRDVSNAD
jgi:hypothetical protein